MTIHDSHPFQPPDDERDSVRRVRGRLPAPVTVWTTGTGRSRVGWTVSSVLVADGDPPHVLGLIDPDSDLGESLDEGDTVVVNVLAGGHQFLAGAFAGLEPAPGGPFTLGEWTQSDFGPVLRGSAGWIGVRVCEPPGRTVGWGLLIDGIVEHAVADDPPSLVHWRGAFHTMGS